MIHDLNVFKTRRINIVSRVGPQTSTPSKVVPVAMESSLAQNQTQLLTEKDTAIVIDFEKEANTSHAETSLHK